MFFSKLYNITSKQRWDIVSGGKDVKYAVLADTTVQVDDQDDNFMVGFELEDENTFSIDKSEDYKNIIF